MFLKRHLFLEHRTRCVGVPLAPSQLTFRGPAFFSILFLRLLGQKWNLVKKVLKVACDADVVGRGHHRVASQVLAAPLDLTCAKCIWGFQVHRHYSLYTLPPPFGRSKKQSVLARTCFPDIYDMHPPHT